MRFVSGKSDMFASERVQRSFAPLYEVHGVRVWLL
jgi:hypothetical protein